MTLRLELETPPPKNPATNSGTPFQSDISKVWQSDCDNNVIKSLEKGHVKCHMISSSKNEPTGWPVTSSKTSSILGLK